MLGYGSVLNTVAHYCDMVWEYDKAQDEIYVLYNKIEPDCEGEWYSPNELSRLFRDKYMFGVDKSVWDRYLNRSYLRSFFRLEIKQVEFYLRFTLNNAELKWYDVLLERVDDEHLVISARDTYDDIKNRSLSHLAKQEFDSILNIDVESRTFITTHCGNTNEQIEPDLIHDYDSAMEKYMRKHAVDDELELIIAGMRFDRVTAALEHMDEYVVFTTLRRYDGELFYKKMTYCYLDDSHRIITMSQSDVSGIVKRYERQLTHFKKETYRDALTGTFNRNYYELNLKSSVLTSGIAVIDLDDFKLCNDTFGHSAGDAALMKLCEVISGELGEDDTLIRYGGDEFLLITAEPKIDSLRRMLEAIREKVRLTRIDEYPNLRLSVSIGGVVTENETADDAVIRADRLMYQAKNKKNCVVTESHDSLGAGGSAAGSAGVRQQILIVDDSEMNRMILTHMLQDEYSILEASNGAEGLAMIEQYGTGISLILLDIVMPIMDGFGILGYMNANHYIEDIPVVMISGEDSDQNIRRAYDLGVSDYILRPFDANVVYRRVQNTITLYTKQRRLISLVTHQSREREKHDRIMIDILSQIVGFRNSESGSHVLHINGITRILLEQLMKKDNHYHLSWQDCEMIVMASTLHDIGKIGIDDSILNKPGRLTPEEFEIMKTHAALGAQILDNLEMYRDEPLVRTASEICRHHHERYDGRGYPDGLAGDRIPISAQVVSIADVYDALVSPRVYKSAFSHEDAMRMIIAGECGVFNPLLLECLQEVGDRLKNEVYDGTDDTPDK